MKVKLHDFYLEKLKRNPVPFHEVRFELFSPIVRQMIEEDMAKGMQAVVADEIARRMRGTEPYPKEVPIGITGVDR